MLAQGHGRDDFLAFLIRKVKEANISEKQAAALLSLAGTLETKDLERFLDIMQLKKRTQAQELEAFFAEIRQRNDAEAKAIEALLASVQKLPKSFWAEAAIYIQPAYLVELPHFDFPEAEKFMEAAHIVHTYLDALDQDPEKTQELVQIAEKCQALKATHETYQESALATVTAPASAQAAVPAHLEAKHQEIRQDLAAITKRDPVLHHFLQALSHFVAIQAQHHYLQEQEAVQRLLHRARPFSDLLGFMQAPRFSFPYSSDPIHRLHPSKVIAPAFERYV